MLWILAFVGATILSLFWRGHIIKAFRALYPVYPVHPCWIRHFREIMPAESDIIRPAEPVSCRLDHHKRSFQFGSAVSFQNALQLIVDCVHCRWEHSKIDNARAQTLYKYKMPEIPVTGYEYGLPLHG